MHFEPSIDTTFEPGTAHAVARRVEFALDPPAGIAGGSAHGDAVDLTGVARIVGAPRVEQVAFAMHDLGTAAQRLPALERIVAAVPTAVPLVLAACVAIDAAATTAAIAAGGRWRALGRPVRLRFVLRADAEVARIGRTPTSLAGVLEASRLGVASGLVVEWVVPLQPALLPRLETIFSLARSHGVQPLLALPSELGGALDTEGGTLAPDDVLFLRDFVRYRLLDEDMARLDAADRTRMRALLAGLVGGRVSTTALDVLVLDADAEGARWRTRYVRRNQIDDAGAVTADDLPDARPAEGRARVAALADMAGVVGEGLVALTQWALAQAAPRDPRGVAAGAAVQLPRVLVIGAYGGEHIGDAAILGGVLFRVHRRFGTTQAILVSQRPEHTRHLVPMLDLPVAIEVAEYRQQLIASLLERCDAVVFAGGPLMDLPKQLVKHLYTVALARRRGLPFVIEGIGVGPFVRRPSEWTARLLARMAGRLTVRTSADAATPLVRGLRAEAGRDPAFDYLETRPASLSRWPAVERTWLATLLHEIGERPLVAINIRPIRHDYTEGAPTADRASFTRQVEARCEEALAAALTRFHDASKAAPCFVFFPMNAIQFGQSDLRSASHILRHVPPRVDFRIWEWDASADGVIALLREADVAICMRFHAAIYALAQGVPVIGVDYRIGRKDKVGALLDDFGTGENCRRIDEITAEWLFERLRALAPGAGVDAGTDGAARVAGA